MEEYVITDGKKPEGDFPVDFVQSVWTGKGGNIRIEPGARPSKILWELKQLLRSIAVGFQWHNVKKLKDRGMHSEHAEAYVTEMLNKLVDAEIPPLPSKVELSKIKSEIEEQDGEDGSSNQVPEQDIS